jgi:hypothetical protein
MTALTFHYETQPLPTWIGWYAHQLPLWIHKISLAVTFGIELALPFLIFAPRRPRQFACLMFVLLQCLILLTGNYAFFNLLTMALCLTLLDDAALGKLLPERRAAIPLMPRLAHAPTRLQWPGLLAWPLATIVLCSSWVQLPEFFRLSAPRPGPVYHLYGWLVPFRSINVYGLFSIMVTNRLELVVEGSNDGLNWEEFQFQYKPGDLMARPTFVEPHQPRLDWQMWFAALSDPRHQPWFVNFCIRLLQGSPEVLALLKHNPFPQAPPRYVRAILYEYHFTDLAARRQTGAWWRRDLKRVYLPPISLTDPEKPPPGAKPEIQVRKPLRLGM